MKSEYVIDEPFCKGRELNRLLFDYAIVFSCLKNGDSPKVLDFGGGTGWVSEFLNRAGYDVTLIDIDPNIEINVRNRLKADNRLDSSRIQTEVCDGHDLTCCESSQFGNIVCFDSLHHMHDFNKVIHELYRVLVPGGRVVFCEPGAEHANSKETKDFLKEFKSDDPSWIERSIFLEEINSIAIRTGFSSLHVKPFLLPNMVDYEFGEWIDFSRNKRSQRLYIDTLKSFNYNSRIIFYADKPNTDDPDKDSAYQEYMPSIWRHFLYALKCKIKSILK